MHEIAFEIGVCGFIGRLCRFWINCDSGDKKTTPSDHGLIYYRIYLVLFLARVFCETGLYQQSNSPLPWASSTF